MNYKGLTSEEVLAQRKEYGFNRLTPAERDPWWKLFIEKFKDPIVEVLCIAAIVSIILGCINGDFLEPVGICIAIFLATFIGFWNEYSAGKKFDILNQVSDDDKVKVYRDNKYREVAKYELVPEDLVILETGEEIPADIRVLEATNLKVNESCLTGETVAVEKTNDHSKDGTYDSNLLLKGTLIEEGSAIGRVISIGDNTEFGQTARDAASITDVETPLNKQLNKLADIIQKCAYWGASILIIALIIRYCFVEQGYVGKETTVIINDILGFVMIAVALIVVAVPEGLPMAVTLALSYSMKKMVASNNLVRKMHACETLGATTLILTDKTGTLTENKMKVVHQEISDEKFFHENIAINSTANLNGEEVIGNPTEGALLKLIPTTYLELRDKNLIVSSVPFNSTNKYMISVIQDGDKYLSLIKGAPEVITNFTKTKIDESKLQDQQVRGRRCLGFAYKLCDTLDDVYTLSDYTLNGFVGIEDPIRSNVPSAIAEAKMAGIKVKIVTGDNAKTAAEIGRQGGITGRTTTSSDDMDNVGVYSRMKPSDKKKLVEAYQRRGEVVACSGDGTNDASALNQAQVGIAMNNGTAVAKEAADIILLDNSFPSIIEGVKWGRSIYKNIQNFITFQLTINVAACLVAICGPFIGVDMPLTVMQMLWINLIMDTFAALALATEPANELVMKDAPRKSDAFIISPAMGREILIKGFVFFITFLYILMSGKYSITEFFTFFVLSQWWNLFYIRVFDQKRNVFNGIFKNPVFLGIASLIIIAQVIIVQFGGELFRCEPLTLMQWGYVILGSFVINIIVNLLLKINITK